MRGRELSPVLILLLSACAPASPAPPPPESGLRDKVIAARSCGEKQKAYREWFTAIGRARVEALEDDPDPSIALQGAWERYRVIGPGLRAYHNLDEVAGERFLYAVRRRVGFDPPDWWKNALLAATIRPALHTYFAQLADCPLAAAGTVDVAGFGKVILPREVRIAGFSFELATDRGWTADVWSAGRTGLGGQGYHGVSFRIYDGKLFVFTVESHGLAVEAFEADSGRPVLRFATSCWFDFPETWRL